MRIPVYGLLLTLLVPPTPLQAMTWGELEAEINAVEAGAPGNREMILRFSEMVHMLVTYTRQLQVQGLPPLVCPTRGQAINIDELVSMVRHEARTEQAGPETLVQELLLSGFRETYPCP